ncbi:MAG: MBOAT family protein [Lachnospiraceae bacterium]|jgi:alginate O-acetyltransferase complex protein AlgI|nr:MBOAT family protein [Lachnospiraceae bacterium]MEE3460337.1 MBOAT family protein [Lachnospiraceae bacterium]
MVFSSLVFLCMFFPCVVTIYYLIPGISGKHFSSEKNSHIFRNLFLLIASLIFYAWGEPVYILIMIFSTVFDYINGRLIGNFKISGKDRAAKAVLIGSIAVNLGILGLFKYSDFIIENINKIFRTDLGLLSLALPIGISFYTFQTMSYTIDVYRGEVKAQKSFINFAMYVALFPQLIAGPIVRYKTIEGDIGHRNESRRKRVRGMQRFIAGLSKKVILANQIGALYTQITASLGTSDMTMCYAWLGALAYAFQIYFDFSGYSDMAIGLGLIFGFHFPENFDHPYESRSITEFWRRWHMTLGTWFREYVYFPLGGNRKGLARQIFNIFIVWALTGLWHGAAWNFVLWGLYFAVLLFIEKIFMLNVLKRLPDWFGRICTFILVVFGWAIFASDSWDILTQYIRAMFGIGVNFSGPNTVYFFKEYLILFIIMALGSTTIPKRSVRRIAADYVIGVHWKRKLYIVRTIYFTVSILLVFVSMSFLISGSYNPFLYFRF